MKVRDVMRRYAATCKPETTLQEAAQIMGRIDCGFLPVVLDNGDVVGLLTDRDICLALATHGGATALEPVSNVMTGEVRTTIESEELDTALERMQEHRVRRLPVLDAGNRLAGILSLDEVILAASEGGDPDYTQLAGALKSIVEHQTPMPLT